MSLLLGRSLDALGPLLASLGRSWAALGRLLAAFRRSWVALGIGGLCSTKIAPQVILVAKHSFYKNIEKHKEKQRLLVVLASLGVLLAALGLLLVALGPLLSPLPLPPASD